MAKHRCEHRHLYIEHLACYAQDFPSQEEYIGFFDIEASNLEADFGIVLSYAILSNGGMMRGRVITPEELRSPSSDKALIKECVRDLKKFDRIVTFYGTNFDIPFVRSRAMLHSIMFPGQGEIYHTDVYWWAKSRLKTHRKRLQVICDFLSIPSKGHPMQMNMWTRALTGDKKCLEYIWVHNQEDVESLEQAFYRLLPFGKLTRASL